MSNTLDLNKKHEIKNSNSDSNNDKIKKLYKVRTIELQSDCFDLEKTLFCGQAFRWQKVNQDYYGVVNHSLVIARNKTTMFQNENALNVENDIDSSTSKNRVTYQFDIYGEDLTQDELFDFFDLNRDYGAILKRISKIDLHLNEAAKYGEGIRIMRQPSFEMLITFILSSNNNIPKITMTVEALCEKFGDCIGEYDHKLYYSFPTVGQLKDASLEALNVKAIGYRAKSVYETVKKIVFEKVDLSVPSSLEHKDAVEWLKQFHGVGEKVANCVLLFGYGDDLAFPIDTWVKRMLSELYGIDNKFEAFVASYFNEFPGIAQQYLFYYIRKG